MTHTHLSPTGWPAPHLRSDSWLADRAAEALAGRFRWDSHRGKWQQRIPNLDYWFTTSPDLPAAVVAGLLDRLAAAWAADKHVARWLAKQQTAARIGAILKLARLDPRLNPATARLEVA